LQYRYRKPRLGKLKQSAIDEIAIGTGQRYLTVVLNLETGAVVFVGDGKGAAALKPFGKRLQAARAQVEAVATDMSPAYTQAVRENLGNAIHVFDHFHVIKLFNEKLSDFRRERYHEATVKMDKEVLKGTRWLLVKNPENLDPRRNEPDTLEACPSSPPGIARRPPPASVRPGRRPRPRSRPQRSRTGPAARRPSSRTESGRGRGFGAGGRRLWPCRRAGCPREVRRRPE